MHHKNLQTVKGRRLRDMENRMKMPKYHLIWFAERDNREYERDNLPNIMNENFTKLVTNKDT